MHKTILIWAILVVAAIFVILTISIVVNKAWRDNRQSRRGRRRTAIEPRVLAYARGRHETLVEALGEPLERRDRPVVGEILLDRLDGVTDEDERRRMEQAFETLGFVDEHMERLDRRNWWTRAESIESLGRCGSERAVGPLTVLLEDPVHEVRLRAAHALGRLGGTAALKPLIRALSEPNRWSTIRIADILMARGEESVEGLMEAFASLNLHARVAALDVLGGIGATSVGPWLRERLSDPETDVRSRAANSLGAIGDLEAGGALRVALADSEWPVRAMAAKALGRILHEEAIPDLSKALRDPMWWVRSNAAEALAAMGPDGFEALKRMLTDSDTFARHQALQMLEETGVLDEEVSRVVDSDPNQRAAAHLLIDRLQRDGQIGRLRALAESHREPAVRMALRSLLPDLETGSGTA